MEVGELTPNRKQLISAVQIVVLPVAHQALPLLTPV